MGIIYGRGFSPPKVLVEDIAKEEKSEKKEGVADLAIDLIVSAAIAVAMIAVSLIPVAGEVADAGLTAAEIESVGAMTASVVETVDASAEAAGIVEGATAIANTAKTLRIGQTIKGSTTLSLTEATVNEVYDRARGYDDPVNTVINYGLAFIPIIGAVKGRRAAMIRLNQVAEKEISKQTELLKIATKKSEKETIKQRIEQLKRIKLANNHEMFSAPIDSRTVYAVKKLTLESFSQELSKGSKVSYKDLVRSVKDSITKEDIRLNRRELNQIVRYSTRGIKELEEGLTVGAIVRSKQYNAVLNVLRNLDPSLQMRRFLTAATRKLSSDEALFTRMTTKVVQKEIGGVVINQEIKIQKEYFKWFKKVNLGFYKDFGKRLSKWWRNVGLKINKAASIHMIPVVSSWIAGYRLITTPVPGEYIMIIIFKPSATAGGMVKPPVVLNPVSLEFVSEFASGGAYNSVGSFYINRIALARNGVGNSLISSLSNILGPLPLGTLRNALALPAAFERIVRKATTQGFFENYFDVEGETFMRLWPHKVGKVLAGRWGIATARGFQNTSKGKTVLWGHKRSGSFDPRYIMEEMAVVTLDKARAVQRKAGVMGRTRVIGGRRIKQQWQRSINLATFGAFKFSGKTGIKKGNNKWWK